MYTQFILEYQKLGRMSLSQNNSNGIEYYLPHHHVIREDSQTTKLRVVFDGYFKTTNGTSLNSIQPIGPPLLSDLFAVLLSFRKNTFVVTADIEKM